LPSAGFQRRRPNQTHLIGTGIQHPTL
jgi:hypothetical protein